jgi:hypothetical protein
MVEFDKVYLYIKVEQAIWGSSKYQDKLRKKIDSCATSMHSTSFWFTPPGNMAPSGDDMCLRFSKAAPGTAVGILPNILVVYFSSDDSFPDLPLLFLEIGSWWFPSSTTMVSDFSGNLPVDVSGGLDFWAVELQGRVLRGSSSVSLLSGGTSPLEEVLSSNPVPEHFIAIPPLIEASTSVASAEEDILPEVEGVVIANPEEDTNPRKKKKDRCLKNLSQARSLFLGMDVKVEHAWIMVERTMVGKSHGHQF